MADGPRLTALGKIFIFLFIGLCGAGAYYFFNKGNLTASKAKSGSATGGMFDSVTGGGGRIELGSAYGTRKQRWLEWAGHEFAKTKDGNRGPVNSTPMRWREAALALR